MFFEELLYTFLGNNIIIGHHIKKQLDFLRKVLPQEFKKKEMHDLGCGDGKVTLLLREIFEAEHCLGYDINERLIRLAQKKGIQAETLNIEEKIPQGELAVIWGVLHHLHTPFKVLKKIKNNYEYIFIREPLKKGCTLFELGNPFKEEIIKTQLKQCFEGCKSYIYKNAIFAFWKTP